MLSSFVSWLSRCVLFFSEILWKMDSYFLVSCIIRFFLILFLCGMIHGFIELMYEAWCGCVVWWRRGVVVNNNKNKNNNNNNNNAAAPHDIFVSFRGKDVRYGFLSHLKEIFQRSQINFFVDDKLEKGYEIWPSLVDAIEGSLISLVVFSRGYASSRWCLEELEKILECNEKYGQLVIPVFYHVKPEDVRHQKGSYKKAFDKHGERYESSKMQIWKHALNKSANLNGFESSNFRNDVELLHEIVKLVLMRLDQSPVNSQGLVGIDE